MTSNNGEAVRTSELSDLIQAAIDRGESNRSIAERAHRAGHSISHAYINSLHRGHVAHAPDTARMEALAAGLSVPVETVRRAVFLDWYGHDIGKTEAGEVFALPPGLSDEERTELDTLVRAWLIARRNG